MSNVNDLNDELFGDIREYKQIVTGLFDVLKCITPETFWRLDSDDSKGLSAVMFSQVIDLILNSYDQIAEELYSNQLVSHEYPYFVETREIVEILLSEDICENDDYLNIAINISSDFFTLLEVKILLYGDYPSVFLIPDEVVDEYTKELDNYIGKFNEYRDKIIELYI